jgi:hypothetical protein
MSVADKGYILNTLGFGSAKRMMFVVEIRLYANTHAPAYHAVVGDVFGTTGVTAALKKIGEIEIVPPDSAIMDKAPKRDHWAPQVWPLPFWAKELTPEP